MTQNFYFADWLVLILYFAGTMGIGFYFYRKTRSSEGFTAGNRSLPGWLCGLSIFATYVSSISYLALPGASFAGNWNPFAFSLSIPLVAWFAARYFLPYYRKSGEVSAYALLEHRFGVWARIYASVFYLLTQLARIAVVLYLMALPMQVIFGWNIYTNSDRDRGVRHRLLLCRRNTRRHLDRRLPGDRADGRGRSVPDRHALSIAGRRR